MEEQQRKCIVYMHSFRRLLSCVLKYIENNDMAGLKEFYEKSLYPINKKIIKDKNTIKVLDNIKYELLYNLLFSLINEISMLSNISLGINVNTQLVLIVLPVIFLLYLKQENFLRCNALYIKLLLLLQVCYL